MGAWSHESFGNDDACDWLAQLEEQDDFSVVESAFDAVIDAGADYLEAPEACEAIAAAEVVARAQGNVGTQDDISQDIDAWLQRVKVKPSATVIAKARRALDRIQTEPSELMELWEESDDADAWRAAVKALAARVSVLP
jgi:hypothetical protein